MSVFYIDIYLIYIAAEEVEQIGGYTDKQVDISSA